MLKGSCLCGSVQYEAVGPVTKIARCHCVQCRKASGAEFATNGSVAASSFRVVNGEQWIGSYAFRPGAARCFCRRCGSPLFKRDENTPDEVRLRLGNLDDASDVTQGPSWHLFVSEKPAWSEITDALPQLARSFEAKKDPQ